MPFKATPSSEKEITHTTILTKQQVYLIKSTMGALNDTLANISHNDKLVRRDCQIFRFIWAHKPLYAPVSLTFLRPSL